MINVWNIFICCLLLTSSCRQETNGDNKVKNENTDSISNEKEEVEPVVTEKQVKRQDVDVVRKDIYDEVVEKEARNIYRYASSIVDYYYPLLVFFTNKPIVRSHFGFVACFH